MQSRRAVLAGAVTAIFGTSGCLSSLTESPEPEQRWHFRTEESILDPSAFDSNRNVRFFQTALLSSATDRPRLRREYLREHAESIHAGLSLDYDRHIAVVIEVILPNRLQLDNRTATLKNSRLKYSFDVAQSDRHSDGPPVNHNLEVWEKSVLSDVEEIQLQLNVSDSVRRRLGDSENRTSSTSG